MREYYGELSNCLEYIEDKNHKAIPWKDYAFSFEIHNSTKYTLELKRGKFYNSFAILRPKEKLQIQIDKFENGEIFVSAKEHLNLECNFEVERGCMIKRNLVEHMEGKVYIAPVFKNGVITIVTCDDCGPDLGAKHKQQIIPLEKPAKIVKVCNFTNYDLSISTENKVVQIIRVNKKKDKKCTSKFVGIPLNGVLYIDTLFEEIAWKDSHKIYEDAILRVNGCCIKINNGNYCEYTSIIGPALSEPYIRHLYPSFGKDLEYEGDINIRCNTIDYRLD